MSNPSLKRLLNKIGHDDLFSSLDKLSLSELNSLMLEVFKRMAGKQSIREILHAYRNNRFVSPSNIDPVSFHATEAALMQHAKNKGFQLFELSPLAPLGSTSAVALVDQNKIVSALRGTEVVADATNVLALEAALRRISSSFDSTDVHYGAIHRHVRAQSFSGKGFTAHFKVFCAVSAGKDPGGFSFERNAMVKHVQLCRDYLISSTSEADLRIIVKSIKCKREENTLTPILFDELKSSLKTTNIAFQEVDEADHRYYDKIRFSINLVKEGIEYNIGDGGLVNWPHKLIGNKKERMFTSGLGIEFLWKLLNHKL
ncbi:MAG TPA: hypothetical protein VFW11_08375 [Cyclobacteriaceae bacterium]|nr:hypothetical protein [Cyclobacteriaceae bacterium]